MINDNKNILNQEAFIKELTTAFENGISLDLINIDGHPKMMAATSDKESYIAECVEIAFQNVDIEMLYDDAEKLGIPDKYPEFYEYLEKEISKLNDFDNEKGPATIINDKDKKIKPETDVVPEDVEPLTLKQTVEKNIVGGEHTGKKRDSEKYRKADEFRTKLNQEREDAISQALENDNKIQLSSYEQLGQIEIQNSEILDEIDGLNIDVPKVNDAESTIIEGFKGADDKFKSQTSPIRLQEKEKKKKKVNTLITENENIVKDNKRSSVIHSGSGDGTSELEELLDNETDGKISPGKSKTKAKKKTKNGQSEIGLPKVATAESVLKELGIEAEALKMPEKTSGFQRNLYETSGQMNQYQQVTSPKINGSNIDEVIAKGIPKSDSSSSNKIISNKTNNKKTNNKKTITGNTQKTPILSDKKSKFQSNSEFVQSLINENKSKIEEQKKTIQSIVDSNISSFEDLNLDKADSIKWGKAIGNAEALKYNNSVNKFQIDSYGSVAFSTISPTAASYLANQGRPQHFGAANIEGQNEFLNSLKKSSSNAKLVDVGTHAVREGNTVIFKTGKGNARNKKYTIRGDNTIVVNGVVLNVFQSNSQNSKDVMVGWKNAILENNKLLTADGTILKFKEKGNSIELNKLPSMDVIQTKGNIGTINFSNGTSNISYAKPLLNNTVTEKDFNQYDNHFATNGSLAKERAKSLNKAFDRSLLNNTILMQGLAMHATVSKRTLAGMRSMEYSNESIKSMVRNYDKILMSGGLSNKARAAANLKLEMKYLNDEERKSLNNLRTKLMGKGINVLEVDKLRDLSAKGKFDAETQKKVSQFLTEYDKTREKIIRNGIINPNNKNGVIENAFLGKSQVAILHDAGVPSDMKSLRKFIKSGKGTAEQIKIAKNALKISLGTFFLKKAGNFIKKNYRRLKSGANKVKNFLNRHMGDDVTFRGAMILLGTLMKPVLAIKTLNKARKIAQSAAKLGYKAGKAVFKTGKAIYKAGKAMKTGARAGLKAGKRAIKMVHKVGVKKAMKAGVKAGTKALKAAAKPIAKAAIRVAIEVAKKVIITTIQIVVKIVVWLVSTLFACLGPVLFVLLIVLGIIFAILAFIKNDSVAVYYDAGDEQSVKVMQEMVDTLTLAHATFRSEVSSKLGLGGGGLFFGGGGSGDGNAGSAANLDFSKFKGTGRFTENGFTVPQLRPGESDKAQGLYDVRPGSWWNSEGNCFNIPWSSGTPQKFIFDSLKSGRIKYKDNGGYIMLDNKYYCVAMGSYWGNIGDVLEVEFSTPIKIKNEPATKSILVIMCDSKAFEHTGLDASKGLYYVDAICGHPMSKTGGAVNYGGYRDLLEFCFPYDTKHLNVNLNNPDGPVPIQVTNHGNYLEGTVNPNIASGGGLGGSTAISTSADLFYRQEIDQDVYRQILNIDKNIFYTSPKEEEPPDGITPTPTPIGYDKETAEGIVFGFYNNNQELIAMTQAIFNFGLNDSTSLKRTLLSLIDTSGANKDKTDKSYVKSFTNKISDDTWRLIRFLDSKGLDLTNYRKGGYDDLKYSTLLGLFNASHIVTHTPVLEYHEGPDGTINPIKNDEGRIIGQANTDGMSYQVPVIDIIRHEELNSKGETIVYYTHEHRKDAEGNLVYETRYKPCLGHRKDSAAIITLHFNSLLNMKDWWEKNIYTVEDFDKENPNYSSDDKKAPNYRAKETVLKRQLQIIEKPDFYKPIPGTCAEGVSNTGIPPENNNPQTAPQYNKPSQNEVAQQCCNYLTSKMGMSKAQAIGVLVNINYHCDFDWDTIIAQPPKDTNTPYGILGWTGKLQSDLIAFARNHNVGAPNTIECQLEYLRFLFLGAPNNEWIKYGGANKFLSANPTSIDAGRAFVSYFETVDSAYKYSRVQNVNEDTVKEVQELLK